MEMLHTPVEEYPLTPEKDSPIIKVKREDLSCPSPGPTFSKMRGLYIHMKKLKEQGIQTVGYVETAVSMAGWGIAWTGQQLGMKVVIYAPVFKEPLPIFNYHFQQWESFGAIIRPIPAGMAKIEYYARRKEIMKEFPNSMMFQLGIPLKESIMGTYEEFYYHYKNYGMPEIIVTCVGSGTICAGLIKAIDEIVRKEKALPPRLFGIMTRAGNRVLVREKVMGKARVINNKLHSSFSVTMIDKKWRYTEMSKCECPFPTHPYYDLKAWQWMTEQKAVFEGQDTLFWNIGSIPDVRL